MPATDRHHSPTPEDIMEYLDGEGTAGFRGEIAAHLVSCAECRAVAAEQRGVSEQAQGWTVPAAPPSLRAPEQPARGRVTGALARHRAKWIFAGLSAAATVLVAVWLLDRPRTARLPDVLDAVTPPGPPSEGRVRVAGKEAQAMGSDSIA